MELLKEMKSGGENFRDRKWLRMLKNRGKKEGEKEGETAGVRVRGTRRGKE